MWCMGSLGFVLSKRGFLRGSTSSDAGAVGLWIFLNKITNFWMSWISS
jgi:hypothetical protein